MSEFKIGDKVWVIGKSAGEVAYYRKNWSGWKIGEISRFLDNERIAVGSTQNNSTCDYFLPQDLILIERDGQPVFRVGDTVSLTKSLHTLCKIFTVGENFTVIRVQANNTIVIQDIGGSTAVVPVFDVTLIQPNLRKEQTMSKCCDVEEKNKEYVQLHAISGKYLIEESPGKDEFDLFVKRYGFYYDAVDQEGGINQFIQYAKTHKGWIDFFIQHKYIQEVIKEETYSVGTLVLIGAEWYILSQIKKHQINLINIRTGNRITDACVDTTDINKITIQDIEKLSPACIKIHPEKRLIVMNKEI